MRCEDCLPLLEELLDGEAAAPSALAARTHLAACPSCSAQYETLRREQEAYDDFLGGVELSPWARTRLMSRIESEEQAAAGGVLGPWRTAFAWLAARRMAVATSLAVVFVLVAASVSLFGVRQDGPQEVADNATTRREDERPADVEQNAAHVSDRAAATPDGRTETAVTDAVTNHGSTNRVAAINRAASAPRRVKRRASDIKPQPAAPLVEVAASNREGAAPAARAADADDLDKTTAKHFEQTRLLLLAFNNRPRAEADGDDVAYEKSRSRVLASRNASLRKEAGVARNRPVETLLERVEPLLLDIAQLPERASPEEVETVRRRIADGSVLFTLRAQSYDAGASTEARGN